MTINEIPLKEQAYMRKTRILISGPSESVCEGVRSLLAEQPEFETAIGVPNGADPLHGVAEKPEILVAVLGAQWEQTLQALSDVPPQQRPPVIAVGPSNNPKVMRRAIHAGVRDYLAPPVSPAELLDAVRRIALELGPSQSQSQAGTLIAVINVKGGSGASCVAANVSHAIATERRTEVGLLDLDLQFGALPLAFDLEQRSMLLEALAAADTLDVTALRGYMARHDSGVHVISAMSEQLILPWEVSADALTKLLKVMRQAFPVTVVDMPRQIDPLTSAVFDQADRILMIMQQSLAHARDAKRMQRVLTATLGIPRERLLLIVNRHSEKQAVRGRDVQDAVNPSGMMLLPNDFATVSEAMNIGVPLCEYDRSSPIARALLDMVGQLGLPPIEQAAGRRWGLRRAIAQALRA